jgi:hypothetical protein
MPLYSTKALIGASCLSRRGVYFFQRSYRVCYRTDRRSAFVDNAAKLVCRKNTHGPLEKLEIVRNSPWSTITRSLTLARRSGTPPTSKRRAVASRTKHGGTGEASKVDYSIPPPVISSPPPPPSRGGLRQYTLPVVLATTLGLVAYFWTNNKNDNFEFWDAMQSGKELPESAFEVEEDDEDEDEEEE